MAETTRQKLVIGISGASGVGYGLRALAACRDLGVESHLILSKAAVLTLADETGRTVAEVRSMANVVPKVSGIGAAVAVR